VALEIERKFLLASDAWRGAVRQRRLLRQAYLANTARCSIRVRIAGEEAGLSVKAMTPGVSRAEYEVGIAVADATAMMQDLREGAIVEKWRHIVPHEGHEWEIDEFLGDNTGLVIAEIELESEDEPFARPEWLGEDVTHDPRYYNFRLAMQPYRQWPQAASGER
jgi:adenylate cyclase